MVKFDPKAFGKKLRAAREELQISQATLSERSAAYDDPEDRISEQYISVLERGVQEGRPSDQMLDAIGRALGHRDPWVIRQWAGTERAPNWATALRAIQDDQALSQDDKELFQSIYMRLVGKR